MWIVLGSSCSFCSILTHTFEDVTYGNILLERVECGDWTVDRVARVGSCGMRLLRLRLPVRRVLRGWFRFVVLVGAPAVCSAWCFRLT